MTQIFYSHSKKDVDVIAFFDQVFAGTKIRREALEFESVSLPASQYIMDQIRNSDAIFVLLGQNMVSASATQVSPTPTSVWVAFEIGFAANRIPPADIWVFEPSRDAPINFPVPFLHHYMLYDLGSPKHRAYIRRIVTAYEPRPRLRSIPKGLGMITCGKCGSSYYKQSITKYFHCPVCRVRLKG